MKCDRFKRARDEISPKFLLFLASLAFACFAKAFGGAYMKSTITQIERRFDIASSHSGAIDGSFEMGNLLVIAFVSYFGSHCHRPRLIGVGMLIMAAGSYITALPHFFQGVYKYETSMSFSDANNTDGVLPCLANTSIADADKAPDLEAIKACEKEAGSSMWILVFVGNMLRGIGETPVMPLGIAYLDDFCTEGNSPLFLSFIQTVGILGPMVGFLLGSYLSKIYVDVGFVDLNDVTITYKDSRWVGAWWMGFIITGTIIALSSIPFWFLPRTLPKPAKRRSETPRAEEAMAAEQENFLPIEVQSPPEEDKELSLKAMAKDFIPSLKSLFTNRVYTYLILTSLIVVNGFIGLITFKPKYIEQVFGQAASKAILYIGIMNLPAVAVGVISGGIFLKRMDMGIIGAARLGMATSMGSTCLLIMQLFIKCDNADVAGLTVTYQGVPQVSYNNQNLLSQCNMHCSCSLKQWDPVCAHNGMTYASPCLAGCHSSTGTNRDMVFHNCTCLAETNTPTPNLSAVLGQCPRESDCNFMFKVYMALSVTGSFISAFGGTSGYIVLLRTVQPKLKSFALGMQTLIVRTLGGIPPPIYFGALIDQTCLKWGSKQCGGVGACRLYDSNSFRLRFMGLVCALYLSSIVLWGGLYKSVVTRKKDDDRNQQAQSKEAEANGVGNGHAVIYVPGDTGDADRESTI